jgi:hypothetical protein
LHEGTLWCRPNANRQRQGLGDGVSMPLKGQASGAAHIVFAKAVCQDALASVSVGCVCVGVGRHGGGRHYEGLRTMTHDAIEKTLETMVERGHARVVGVTEGGKKRYILTEGGMFAGEPNVEFALLMKGRHVIMAIKHPTEAPVQGEDAALNIFLCDSVADSGREDAVEIWGFVLPFDQRDIDFEGYTCEGFDPTEIEFACRSAGLWRDWKDTFENVVIREKLEPRKVAAARVFLDRFCEKPGSQ